MKLEFEKLYTPFEKDLNTDKPWDVYPRPQFKRSSFINLNGKWNLEIIREGEAVFKGEIIVPFPFESRLSGVDIKKERGDALVYTKTIMYSPIEKNVILHFGAVDQICDVFVNGESVGTNVGGYLPFSFDITKNLKHGENVIKVYSHDLLLNSLAYGKQSLKRGGMWYTETSGIWQTVWLEEVPKNYIKDIKVTPDLNGFDITVDGGENEKTLYVNGKRFDFSGESARIEIENPEHWTPENPKLYDFSLISGEDEVQSYTALRTISVDGNKILLNNKPYFFHGLLDQGYFSDGIYTPATPEAFENDILQMKKCGFNTLRKHIKIEHELFYYYCDKLGMAVFQDFVNCGKYSFFVDTALPTIGLKKGISHKATSIRREQFIKDSEGTIKHLNNHPCVLYYTIFNEGWGQFDAKNIYTMMKDVDPTRVWDATSGWFQTGKSDVLSEHIYFKALKFKLDGRPLVLSEFGGYSSKICDHAFNKNKTYGYKLFDDNEKFKEALLKLYHDEVVPAIKKHGLCAAILTQVSDVEDETNGLLTYDRQILKVDPEKMTEMAKALSTAYEEYCKV